MNFNSIKKISLAVCFSITAIASGFAQTNSVIPNWNFGCNDDSYVEIVGTGTQTPGAPPSILNISNIANVDSIMVEVIYKGIPSGVPHAAIIQTSNGDSIYNANPVVLPSLGSNHVAGAFRTTIGAASSISAYVTPPNAASNTWAMIAYVYRSGNGIGSTSAGVYAQPLILNTNWMINLPIPVTATSKTVEILTPIVELDNAIDRLAIVSVITAGISQIDTIYIPNAGTSLNLHTITLNNVPAAANKVTVDFISPANGTGDSFIGSAMVTVNNTCPELVGIKVDAKTNVTCTNGNDGIIDIHAIGGIAPYTYLWNDGATTEDRTNLTTGTYTVTVTDNQGSAAVITRNINTKPQVKLSATKIDILCKGFSNGSIDVTAISGAAPYVFLWNDGATTEDRQNLNVGVYTVTVIDANGCSKNLSKKIIQPTKLKLRLVKNDVTCNKNDDGIIEATISGGKLPYTYLWNDGVTTEDRSGLAKGSYSLMVADANGCTISRAKFVNQPKRMNVAKTITDVNCFGESNGAIALNVSGGNGNNSYAWNTAASTKDIGNLVAGNYQVIITDAKGCQSVRFISVNQPDELVLSTVATDVLCFGQNSGSAMVIASGGTETYTYYWSNNTLTQLADNLTAGTYSVIVTDANGCIAYEDATIIEPAQMVINRNTVNVTCNGGNNGVAKAIVIGGTSPYTYVWSNGETSLKNINLTAGMYTVSVTDANGCVSQSAMTIAQPLAISSIITNTNVSCKNGANGTAQISVANGVAPFTFLWSNDATTINIDNLTAATYSATITDINGCTSANIVIVNEPSETLTVNAVGENASCSSTSSGSVNIAVNGGNPGYKYEWSNGETTEDLNSIYSGTYTVTVTDADGENGCSVTESITIENISNLNVLVNSLDPTCNAYTVPGNCPCNGKMKEVTLIYQGVSGVNIDVDDKNGNYLASFTNVQYNQAITVDARNNTPVLGVGTYDLGPKIYLRVNSGSAVEIHTSCSVQIVGLTYGDFFVIGYIDKAGSVCGSSSSALCDGSITSTVSGGVAPYSYTWIALNDPNANLTGSNLNGLCPGDYSLTVIDNIGCSKTILVTLNDPACNSTPRYASVESTNKLENLSLNLFPNPSKGNVTLEYEVIENSDVSIYVIDVTGRIIMEKMVTANSGLNETKMDLNNLNNGVYFVKLNNDIASKMIKLVIQK